DATEDMRSVRLAEGRAVPRAEHPRAVSRPAAREDERFPLGSDGVEDPAEGIGHVHDTAALPRLHRRWLRRAHALLGLPELPLDAEVPDTVTVHVVPEVVVEPEAAQLTWSKPGEKAGHEEAGERQGRVLAREVEEELRRCPALLVAQVGVEA